MSRAPAEAVHAAGEPEPALQVPQKPRAAGSLSPRDALLLSVIRFSFLVGALVAAAWTTTDPDLWGHVQFGRDILETRSLETADPYSFTSDRSWVNHEWLAEVVFALALAAGGPPGLVAVKMLVLVGIVGIIIVSFRHLSWNPIPHDLLIALALVGTLVRHHTVRPQLFSLVLFAAMVLALIAFDRGRRRAMLVLPVLFALWANFHGGFLVGLGVLAAWLAVRLLQTPRSWPTFLAIGFAALAATLLNPYGFGLWQFLWDTVDFGRPMILDWQPVWAAAAGQVKLGWALITLTAAAALWCARGRVDPAAWAVTLLLAVASLRVNRVDAFYALAVVMLLGPLFARQGPRPAATAMRPWAWAACAAVTVMGLVLFERRASCLDLVKHPEAEATAFLAARSGRVLTYFDWGEYAIWHLAPAVQVSMDGRRETVYSDELVDAHMRLYQNEPGATALVARLQPDLIWLPRSFEVIETLQSEGWKPLFRGPVSVVLARDASEGVTEVDVASAAPRCFPDR